MGGAVQAEPLEPLDPLEPLPGDELPPGDVPPPLRGTTARTFINTTCTPADNDCVK